MTYYNTNGEKGKRLDLSHKQADSQELTILKYFLRRNNHNISPTRVQFVFSEWPITSIRRAITNLTKAGLLVKTEAMTMGGYGKLEHTWKTSPSTK